MLAIDLGRTVVSLRTARRYRSEALLSNALHFGSDFVGTLAVLAGLIAATAGFPEGDSIAALFVAALVLVAAARLMRRNVDVLMDNAPADAEEAARAAIARIEPPVELSRLRLRQAAGRTFADVVISVPPGAAVGQGHAVADRVEAELERALPGSDVVVHVEPDAHEAALRERAHAAALSVPRVREIHNLSVVSLGGATALSLHLKLPGDLSLEEAHELAEEVERAILRAVPEIGSVQTHLEPLAEAGAGRGRRGGRARGCGRAGGGRAAAGAAAAADRERRRRVPDARARPGLDARRGARPRERGRGALAPRAAGRRGRDRAHRTVGFGSFTCFEFVWLRRFRVCRLRSAGRSLCDQLQGEPMRKLITMLALTLAALALSATAFANGDGRGHDGQEARQEQRAKRTFTVTTTDNGSCGAAWATDVVKRTFFVKKHKDGSYTLDPLRPRQLRHARRRRARARVTRPARTARRSRPASRVA